ncbi:MAG: TonB-dependent receptor [Arenicella sp.]
MKTKYPQLQKFFPIKTSLSILLFTSSVSVYAVEEKTVTGESSITPLPSITVDARLWDEETNDVPGSVELIDDSLLSRNHTNSVDVIANRASNVVIEESSAQTRVVIRGNAGIDLGLQDPVGYFVNDIALPLGGNQLPDISNFNQIQVLKGPQGSTYGRNTETGAIKLATRDIDWNLSRWLSASTGAVDGADGWTPTNRFAIGASNTLIPDVLAGSLGVNIEKTTGPYFNRLSGSDEGGEIERWSLQSGLHYMYNDHTDIQLKSIVEQNDKQRTRFRFQNGPAATDRFITNSNTEGFDDEKTAVHSLKITHEFANYELTSITGISDYERDFMIDLDATPAPLPATQFSLNDNALSQELRLSNLDKDSALRWLLGLYAYDQSTDIDFSISPFFVTTQRTTRINQTGIAGFGQVEYQLSPKLDVGVGLRVERTEQEGQQSIQSMRFNGQYVADIDETEVLPKLTLAYAVSDVKRIYFSAAKGYLPGGYNYNSAGSFETFTYAPEYSTNYEIGLKSSFLNDRIKSNVAAFYTQVEDKQVVDVVPGGLQRISNAAEAEVKGVEWSLDASIGHGFSVFSTLGWQDAEATSYQASVFNNGQLRTVDLSGNQLTLASDYTYSLGLAYGQSKPQGFLGNVTIRGASEYYFDSQNTLQQPSYTLVDAEVGYQFKTVKLSFWAKNLFDEATISRAVNTPNGVVVEDSNPRVLGLQLTSTW